MTTVQHKTDGTTRPFPEVSFTNCPRYFPLFGLDGDVVEVALDPKKTIAVHQAAPLRTRAGEYRSDTREKVSYS